MSLPIAPAPAYNSASMRGSRHHQGTIATRVFALAGVILGAVVLYSGSASAQGKKIVFGDDSELAGSEVIGTVHKPEVVYVITRQEQEDLETLQLKESFIPKIVKSVEKKPF